MGRVGIALDYSAGSAALDALREGAARICGRKARKHGTGTLFELPDEHFWPQTLRLRALGISSTPGQQSISPGRHAARRYPATTAEGNRCRRRPTPAHPRDSPPHHNRTEEGPHNYRRRVTRLRSRRLREPRPTERGPLLPLPGDPRLGPLPGRHHARVAGHRAGGPEHADGHGSRRPAVLRRLHAVDARRL